MVTPEASNVQSRLLERFLVEKIWQHRYLWGQGDATYAKKGLKTKADNAITLLLRQLFEELAKVTAGKLLYRAVCYIQV